MEYRRLSTRSVREFTDQLAALRNQVDQQAGVGNLGRNHRSRRSKYIFGGAQHRADSSWDKSMRKISIRNCPSILTNSKNTPRRPPKYRRQWPGPKQSKTGCEKARSKLGVMESGKTHRDVLGKLLTFSDKCNTAITGWNTEHRRI